MAMAYPVYVQSAPGTPLSLDVQFLPPEPEPTDPFPGLPPSGPAGPGTKLAMAK